MACFTGPPIDEDERSAPIWRVVDSENAASSCGSPNGCAPLIEREQKYHLRQSVQPAQMYDSRCRSVVSLLYDLVR
jgi:hypothetical protein